MATTHFLCSSICPGTLQHSDPVRACKGGARPLFTSKYIPLLKSGAFVVPLILALVLNFRKRPFQKVQVKPVPATVEFLLAMRK